MQSKELSSERKTQEVIISELAGLTEILKQTTLKIHLSVQRQNMQLQEMQHFAEQNDEELEKQKQKVKYPKWIEIYIASLMITCMLLE
jgi:beta-lactam-binding protein with PASTA domain